MAPSHAELVKRCRNLCVNDKISPSERSAKLNEFVTTDRDHLRAANELFQGVEVVLVYRDDGDKKNRYAVRFGHVHGQQCVCVEHEFIDMPKLMVGLLWRYGVHIELKQKIVGIDKWTPFLGKNENWFKLQVCIKDLSDKVMIKSILRHIHNLSLIEAGWDAFNATIHSHMSMGNFILMCGGMFGQDQNSMIKPSECKIFKSLLEIKPGKDFSYLQWLTISYDHSYSLDVPDLMDQFMKLFAYLEKVFPHLYSLEIYAVNAVNEWPSFVPQMEARQMKKDVLFLKNKLRCYSGRLKIGFRCLLGYHVRTEFEGQFPLMPQYLNWIKDVEKAFPAFKPKDGLLGHMSNLRMYQMEEQLSPHVELELSIRCGYVMNNPKNVMWETVDEMVARFAAQNGLDEDDEEDSD